MTTLCCATCGKSFAADEPRWRCTCGGLLDLDFHAKLKPDRLISRASDMWRYREVLPIDSDENIISYGEGFTPLQKIVVNGRKVYAKLDFLFPTGSYKDRGAALLVSKIKE